MAIIFPSYLKYFSVFILIFSLLYQYEISTDKKTLLITKQATFKYNRSHVYKIITNIDKYPLWYPNVAIVEPIQSDTKSHQDKRFRLTTKLFLLGNSSSILTVNRQDQPKRLIFSLDNWLHEINAIELKENSGNINSTDVQWIVYTTHRNFLFQYILFPFAKFYKNQIVREALFSLMLQIRYL